MESSKPFLPFPLKKVRVGSEKLGMVWQGFSSGLLNEGSRDSLSEVKGSLIMIQGFVVLYRLNPLINKYKFGLIICITQGPCPYLLRVLNKVLGGKTAKVMGVGENLIRAFSDFKAFL